MKQTIEHYENRSGGKGTMHIERLLLPEEMGPHVKMYAKVTIDQGASLGYHPHIGDRESYYILQGHARYQEDGQFKELHTGDITNTLEGHSHGIENIGDEKLIFMALIIAAE